MNLIAYKNIIHTIYMNFNNSTNTLIKDVLNI